MPTYEYECEACGLRFERRQAMTEAALVECPECRGQVHRRVSGGLGLILKGTGHDRSGHHGGACSLEHGGGTCCGREERCSRPPCEE